MENRIPIKFHILPGYPDFSDLPWESHFEEWPGLTDQVVQVESGVSRHPIVFVYIDGSIYAIKELPHGLALQEFKNLRSLEKLRLPTVRSVGYVGRSQSLGEANFLITEFLKSSIPYRSIFLRNYLDRYREHILDAMAGLLVQLHLNGIYWGDCSLSNTLFRRDAGILQAYLVDGETIEIRAPRLNPTLRLHDLDIMQENIPGELSDNEFLKLDFKLPISEISDYIRRRYQELWEEITREVTFRSDEQYKIQDRISALNYLGFSIKDMEILPNDDRDRLRLRVVVADRNFHRDRLFEMTGIVSEEMQAQQMMNEIQQVRATLSRENNRNTSLSAAAHYWLDNNYEPVIEQIHPLIAKNRLGFENSDPAELYCQILENKWFLSEKANKDIGHRVAAEDYLKRFAS